MCHLPAARGDVAGAIGGARAIERVERVGEVDAVAAFRFRERTGCRLMAAQRAEALRLPAVRASILFYGPIELCLGSRDVFRAGFGMGRQCCAQQDEDGDPAFRSGCHWSILCLDFE